jgi:hypothetical protein
VSPSRRLRWGLPERPLPKHPYRDTVLVYGGLAVVIVLAAWATGGAVGRAVVIAALFFVVATAWNAYRWRARARARAAASRARAAAPSPPQGDRP